MRTLGETKEDLARRVTHLMVKRKISQSDLARTMGSGRAVVHRILHPDLEGSITLATLSTLADALGMECSIRFRPRRAGRPRKTVGRLYRWGHGYGRVKVKEVRR